jgi:TolB-like protein/DNA-binding SARP family transcriptional activator/Tfp pilus assembly protein PilF
MRHLKLLGSPSLEADDGSPITGRVTQRHRVGILALLALTPGQRLGREKLMALLWPESDPERGRNSLKVSIYVLRTEFGEAALVSGGDDVRLNPDAVRVDVAAFETAAGQGDHARAVSLYTGPFLDGFFLNGAPEFDEWADEQRRRLAGIYAKSLESLAEEAEARYDHPKAAEWWSARAALDRFDSRVAFRLMRSLQAGGNSAAALQHAAAHTRLLETEVGVAPPQDIVALADRLRRESPALAPLRNAGTVAPAAPLASPPLVGLVAETAVPLPEPSPAAQPSIAARGRSRRTRWFIASAVMGTAVIAAAAWTVWSSTEDRVRSIVVLPFLDLSPNRDNEYFTDGVTEEIITRLSGVPGLTVISRTSAMHYKGTRQPLREIARELNVDHVLEGSIRQADGRLRVTAQLIEPGTDTHLWAQNYDYEARDIFRVQENIAQEVVRALEVKLGRQAERLLVKQGTRDEEAFRLYQRGRFLWNTRTRAGHDQATAYYQQALARDSSYADAYAGIAYVHLTAYMLNIASIPEAESYSRLKWAAERALAIDDESADAHVSFALALWWQRNWPGAARELRRAIELNPNHVTARTWYSLLLRAMGRPREALLESRRAAELDPFSTVASNNYGWNCYHERDFNCALEQFQNAIEVNNEWWSGHRNLALVYVNVGNMEEALVRARLAVERSPDRPDFIADLAYVQARAGRIADARESLRMAKTTPWEPFTIGRAHVALNEPDSAMTWLERARWQWPNRAERTDPALDPIRSDPRFVQLSARVSREMGIR